MDTIPELHRHQMEMSLPKNRTHSFVPEIEENKLFYEGEIYSQSLEREIEMFPDSEQNPEQYEKKGYVKILPMKARDYVHDKHSEWWTNPAVAVQAKHDGVRGTLHIRNYVNRFFTGREVKNGWTGEKTDRIPHIRDFNMYEYRGTVLDGELISPNGAGLLDFKYVTSVLGSKPLKAVTKQYEEGFLVYTVFDVVYYKGYYVGNLPHRIRFKLMMNILFEEDKSTLRNPYIIPTFTVGETPVQLGNRKIDRKDYYHYLFELGVEGAMLKNMDKMIYKTDYKSFDVLKLKQIITLDMVCIGFTEANEGKTGQFKGMIGAMKLGVYMRVDEYNKDVYGEEVREYVHLDGSKHKLDRHKTRILVEMGNASGMDVPARKDMTDNPTKYLNEVVEIKCNDIFKDTFIPRNPRFIRMHEQKSGKQCTFEAHKEQSQAINLI